MISSLNFLQGLVFATSFLTADGQIAQNARVEFGIRQRFTLLKRDPNIHQHTRHRSQLATHVMMPAPGPTISMPAPPVSPRKKDLGYGSELAVQDENGNVKYTGDQAWLNDFDLEAFRTDIRDLGKRLESQQGPADMVHLNKIINWSNAFALIGLLTLGLGVNPISIIALSLWTFSRWTMIGHHTCHGGYSGVDETGRFNRGKFAIGTLNRRVQDWFDWMLPEAWNHEHNVAHHYNLGEEADPDLVERNLDFLRDSKVPKPVKYIAVAGMILSWKWLYYAPNTYKELKIQKMKKEGKTIPDCATDACTLTRVLQGHPIVKPWELVNKVMGPYFLIHFFLLPAPFALFGSSVYMGAVINLILADLLTNIHSFMMIVPNHAGKDMYKFSTPTPPNSGEFYLRQVLSSANFNLGNDYIDFASGWLNYQIEHHMWPNLSMLSYQKSQKEVEAICEKHGVPYIKENVFLRTKKTIDVMVGDASMRPFPEEWSRRQASTNLRSALESRME